MSSSIPEKSKKNKRIFLSVFYVAFLLVTVVLHVFIDRQSKTVAREKVELNNSGCPNSLGLIRGNSTDLVQSLYLADITEECNEYLPMKEYLNATIREEISKGTIKSASVYFRNLNDASWMSIDADQPFYPGSMMKVPIMIYYLQKEQVSPGFLNRELSYDPTVSPVPDQEFQGKSILPGKKYKISELLRYMIVESDNKATAILGDNMDTEAFWKIFRDLRIPTDRIDNINYQITPREFSKFLRVLFSATYVNEKLSEYGLKLLSESRFDKGIAKDLPPDLTVARKFGEHLSPEGTSLSESAIVYYDSHPYLMIIMTFGNDFDKQARLISEISYQVYTKFKEM